MKLRRKWYQWLADKTGYKAHIDRESLLSMYRIGEKAGYQAAQDEIKHASVHFFGQPPSAVYEPPERTTPQPMPAVTPGPPKPPAHKIDTLMLHALPSPLRKSKLAKMLNNAVPTDHCNQDSA